MKQKILLIGAILAVVILFGSGYLLSIGSNYVMVDACDATAGWAAANANLALDTADKTQGTGSLSATGTGWNVFLYKTINLDMSSRKILKYSIKWNGIGSTPTLGFYPIGSPSSYTDIVPYNEAVGGWQTFELDITTYAMPSSTMSMIVFGVPDQSTGAILKVDDIEYGEPTTVLSVSVSPTGGTMTVGASYTFIASVTGGSGTYSYSWTVNSVQQAASTNTFVYTPTATGTVNIQCSVNDGITTASSNIATYTVSYQVLSISITPTGGTMVIGNSYTFTATATGGTGTYVYTWFVNSVSQSSTSTTFTYAPTSPGSVNIQCSVNDGNSQTPSNIASYTISYPQMTNVISPASGTLVVGNTYPITATVTGGSGTYTYSWSVNSVVQSQTTRVFSFTPTAQGSASVQCTANDGYTNAPSNVGNFQVNPAPVTLSVTIYPDTGSMFVGSSYTITAIATGGSGTYTYSWTVNNQAQTGTTSTLVVSPTTPGTVTIHCVVNDGVSQVTSNTGTYTVSYPTLSVTISPISGTMTIGSTYPMIASAIGGTGTYSYAWYVNSQLQSATEPIFSFTPSMIGTAAANIYCIVSDGNSQVTSITAVFDVIAGPGTKFDLTITSSLGGSTNPNPGQYSYDAGTSGVTVEAIPSYGYLFDHWVINGAESSVTLPTLVLTMDQDYSVNVLFKVDTNPPPPPPPGAWTDLQMILMVVGVGSAVASLSYLGLRKRRQK